MTKKWGRRRNHGAPVNLADADGMRMERKNSMDETGSDVSSGSDDGNYSGPSSNAHMQHSHMQRMSHMNPQATSFSPTQPKAMNPAAVVYKPAYAAPRKNSITIKPTEFSTEDIYEHSRVPSGIVVTTTGGQRIEFWDRVHVPHHSEGSFHSKEQWTNNNYNPYGSVS